VTDAACFYLLLRRKPARQAINDGIEQRTLAIGIHRVWKMNLNISLDRASTIVQLVANVSVVLSLFIIVYQVGENTKAIVSANRQSLSDRTQELLIAQAADVEFSEMHIRATRGGELAPKEQSQYAFYFAAALRIAEEAYLKRKEGQLSDDYWRTRANNLLYRMRSGFLRDKWSEWQEEKMYSSDFSSWLDCEVSAKYGD
jgi:hypothetical protein